MSAARFQSGLRPPFISSLSPPSLPASPRPDFCRTPGLLLYTTRTNTATNTLTLALVRAFFVPLPPARRFALLLFGTHRPPRVFSFFFFFAFLPRRIAARPLFGGRGTNDRESRDHPVHGPRAILYNACNGCCDAARDTLLPNVMYGGETIARTFASANDPFRPILGTPQRADNPERIFWYSESPSLSYLIRRSFDQLNYQ